MSEPATQDTNSTTRNGGSFDFYGMTSAEVIALTVISSGISVIGTLSNIFVILAVLLTRQLREMCTAVLLISLSLTDVMICAVYEPMYIYDINCGSNAVSEAVRFKLGFGLFLASLNGEFIVTLDRFIYICFPYRYIDWTSTNRVTISAFCAQWFVAVLLTLSTLFTSLPLYAFFYIAVIIILIVALHISMYCTARREARQISCQYPTASQNNDIWNKSTAVVAMTVAVSLLCWAPIVCLPAVVPPSSPSFKRYIKITLAFTSLSAVLDPFIFCWRLKDFRKALATCLRKLRNSFHCN
ncbi:melanocyte-stimulating hormone receptor-like [Oculina patagonica]